MKNIFTIAILLVFLYSTRLQAQVIYGTTSDGGLNSAGLIFKYTPTPHFETVFNFGYSGPMKSAPPESPVGNLLLAGDGLYYGISSYGGDNYEGTLYAYDPDEDTLGVLINFSYTDGTPVGGIVETPGGLIIGNSAWGGANYNGSIFSYNINTKTSSTVYSFTSSDGSGAYGGPTLHSNGKVYFVSSTGGTNSLGAILQLDPVTSTVVKKLDLDTTTGNTMEAPMSSYNGKLYGLFSQGGIGQEGTLVRYDPATNNLTVLYSFSAAKGSADGYMPHTTPIVYNGVIYGTTKQGGIYGSGVLFKYDEATSTYTKLVDFKDSVTGMWPNAKLTVSNDGWLYGACYKGGAYNKGTFFKYNVNTNTLVKLMDYNGVNGSHPTVGGFLETIHLKFTASDTVKTSPPFTITFNNQTPNSSNYIWQWQFGDGSVSYQKNPVHTYNSNGTYTVTLIANDTVNHRQDTLMKQSYIQLSGAPACPAVANINPAGIIDICPGDSVALHVTNYNSANSYQWLRTGLYLNGATDTVIYVTRPGYYQVRVDNGSCWNFSNVAWVRNYPTQPPAVTRMPYMLQPCTDDSMHLQVTNTYTSYLWSTGDTTSDIYVKTSGFYTVTILDNNGCSVTSLIDTVNAALVPAPELCIVGVDSASGHNMIVWNQTADTRIDSFRVYKEGPNNNEFHLIGAKARTETAMLIDPNSDPRMTSYRYRLMAVDSCGYVTPWGPYHRTIHLMVNYGQNGAWNLWWNPYEGAELGTYYIYRGTDSLQMQLIASIPTSGHTYTDLNPPAGDVYYMLKASLPNACNPGGGTSYNLSASNFFNTRDATVGLQQVIEMHSLNVGVYPNPNSGRFTLRIESAKQQKVSVMIFNSMGSLISSEQINVYGKTNRSFDLSTMSKGVYFIRLQTDEESVVRKIIVQ